MMTSGGYLYITAGDAATMYDTPNSALNANYTSGTNYTGTGVTIGIGGDAQILAATVVDYRKVFVGDTKVPLISYNTASGTIPSGSNSDADEAYIDTQLSSGIAPGATIHYYASYDLFSAVEQAAAENTVDIFSLSFGECEQGFGISDNAYVNNLWQQFASQGIAVTVSTGDSGAAGCDNPNSEYFATYGLQVNGLASTPYNIAVGGTDTYGLNSSFSTYVGSSNSASNHYRTVKAYIPESTWNDSTQVDGLLSANVDYLDSSNRTNIVGGSGGVSNCVNVSTSITNPCVSGYPKPNWQRGTGVPADSARDIPDVSLMGGNGADYGAWLVCTDDQGYNSASKLITANCTTQSDGSFYFQGFGGTSTSAPAFAGILALAQQKIGSRLGQAAKTLYDLYNGSHASAIFHDITQGNISVPCVSGTTNCSKNAVNNYFLTGFDTTAGYDLATGIGSVDAKNLVTYWTASTGSGTATVTVSPSVTTMQASDAITVLTTVAGSGSTPTGMVSFSGGGYSATGTLSSGSYTFSIPASSLSAGTDTLTVTYAGDANYSSATGSAQVTVNSPTAATPAFSPVAGTYNNTQTVTISTTTSGATIYYTINGTTPTSSSTKYTAAVKVTTSETLQAIAVKSSYTTSAVGSAAYVLQAATPTFSVAGGTYSAIQTVTLASTTTGASIYYTLDGSTPTTSSTKYTAAIKVSTSETVNAIAVATNFTASAVASATYTLNLPTVATPAFSVAAGTYNNTQTVTLSTTTSGATIYYTTNGTTPTTSSTKYTAAIKVSTSETLSAIAVATGYNNSAVGAAAYVLQAATPSFSVAGGTYASVQTVTLADATASSTIYYTLDGSTPTTSSTKYTAAIKVSTSETVNAIAVATGFANSAVASAAYTINLPNAATPTFSVAAGTYNNTQTVTLATTTSGATIYYTTNGTAPTSSSSKYTAAIKVATTETLSAIAVATGYNNSAVGTAAYTLQAAAPAFSVAGGTYTSIQTVSLTDATTGSTIYYTVNGTTPTTGSTKYTAALKVSASETVNAIAVATGFANSTAATAAYTINLPTAATPTFSVAGGPYNNTQTVTLSTTTSGATIYYTTNGTAPTASSTKYTAAIKVATTERVNAIAVATGYNDSAVGTAAYVLQVAAPTFSPVAGTYTGTQTVKLTTTTTGATIYYTINGNIPTSSSTKYTSAGIKVTASETVNAIGVATGFTNSAVATAAYTIK